MDDDKLKDDFHDWWTDAARAVGLSPSDYDVLQGTFFKVLSAMPETEREAFFENRPHIICTPDYGFALCIWVAPWPRDDLIPVSVIFLRHDVIKHKSFIDTVAHEIAHIVRGDHKASGGPEPGVSYEHEKGADDLSESWGFKRCYGKTKLAKLKSHPRA